MVRNNTVKLPGASLDAFRDVMDAVASGRPVDRTALLAAGPAVRTVQDIIDNGTPGMLILEPDRKE